MSEIREPKLGEAGALAALARESFVETFGDLYSSEDLGTFLEGTKTRGVFAAQMQDSQYFFQVAEEGGQLVGYCKMGLDPEFDDYDPGERRVIELKELYLLGTHQGTLSVWSGNAKAQRFYQKYGFSWLVDTHFMVGNQRDEEFLFMCPMTADQA
jgi:diamine N-acetyltransferase